MVKNFYEGAGAPQFHGEGYYTLLSFPMGMTGTQILCVRVCVGDAGEHLLSVGHWYRMMSNKELDNFTTTRK